MRTSVYLMVKYVVIIHFERPNRLSVVFLPAIAGIITDVLCELLARQYFKVD